MKVGFVLRSEHTNMTGWLDGLERLGHDWCALTLRSRADARITGIRPPLRPARTTDPQQPGGATGSRQAAAGPAAPQRPAVQGRSGSAGFPLRTVVGWLRRERPDVVVVRLERFKLAGTLALLAASVMRIPCALYTQDPVYAVTRSPAFRLAHAAAGLRGWPWFTPSLVRMADLQRAAVREDGLMRFVPFAAPLITAEPPAPTGSVRVLVSGDYKPRKRTLEALDVVAALPPDLLDAVEVTVVGSGGRSSYYTAVSERVQRLAAQVPVSFHTSVPHEAYLELLSRHDVMVHHATAEPASVSQIEAMGHGVAVLIAPDNGTAHYVADGVTGRVYDGTEEGLRDALIDALSDRDRLACWQRVAQRRSRHEWAPEVAAARLVAVLRRAR